MSEQADREMDVDCIVLGAGLAGLSVADSLLDVNKSVIVLETEGIAAGASGTPVGLINPATGRRGKKVWKVEKALPAIFKSIKSASSFSDDPFYVQRGVLRPALDTEMAYEMHKRFKKSQWPSGWCYWLTEKEIRSFHPGINCVNGGLWLPVGMAVDVPEYLQALTYKIRNRGGQLIIRPSYTFHRYRSNGWKVVTDRNEKIAGKKLIFATGAELLDQPIWSDLPLNAVKGQVAIFNADRSLDFAHSISAKGYIAHINGKQLTIGSTYEHHYKDLNPNEEGFQQLKQKLDAIIPKLSRKLSYTRQWAGVRVSATDHKPVLGAHSHYKNLFVFTGLGSKGLLHGKYLANRLTEYIIKGRNLPQKVSIQRFSHLLN